MARGIIEKTLIDTRCFPKGSYFHAMVSNNDFRVFVVVECTEELLTLKSFYPEELVKTFTAWDLHRGWSYHYMTEMKPDYNKNIGE